MVVKVNWETVLRRLCVKGTEVYKQLNKSTKRFNVWSRCLENIHRKQASMYPNHSGFFRFHKILEEFSDPWNERHLALKLERMIIDLRLIYSPVFQMVYLFTQHSIMRNQLRVIIFDQVYKNLTCHGAKFNVYSWADLFPLWKFSKTTL